MTNIHTEKGNLFWTQKRKSQHKADKQKLAAESNHSLIKSAFEYDGLMIETLQEFRAGLTNEWGKDWLAFPYETGIQLYRREKGKKIIRSVEGSKPKNSFFCKQENDRKNIAIIAKSPRETMLLDQLIGKKATIIGLCSGEMDTLSNKQEQYLRGALKGINSVYVFLDTETQTAKSISMTLSSNISKITNKEVYQADISKLSNGKYKDITDAVQDGMDEEYVFKVIENADTIKSIDNITPTNSVSAFESYPEVNPKPFSQEIYQKLPEKLKELCLNVDADYSRDVFLMAALPVIAAHLINVSAKNTDGTISPDLFSLVIASAAAGKGVANKAKQLGLQLSNFIRDQSRKKTEAWEADKSMPKPKNQSFYIPANSSSRAVYDLLEANGERGLIFESEIDTMLVALSQEWGDFSDLTRKAFHHEDASLSRKNELLQVNSPKLSIFMSGTFDQFKEMFRNTENGLYSRFALYTFTTVPKWKSQRPTEPSNQLNLLINQASRWLFDLYMKLSNPSYSVEIKLTDHQWSQMDEYFVNKMDVLLDSELSNTLEATVKRSGTILLRIAMILTMIREYENLGDDLFNRTSVTVKDVDFQNATKIVDNLQNHAFYLFNQLPKKSNVNLNNLRKEGFFSKLPMEFQTEDATTIGQRLGIPKITVNRYLKDLTRSGNLVKIQHGQYGKLMPN